MTVLCTCLIAAFLSLGVSWGVPAAHAAASCPKDTYRVGNGCYDVDTHELVKTLQR